MRSSSVAFTKLRAAANRPARAIGVGGRRLPIGLGLGLAALASAGLWIAAADLVRWLLQIA